MGKILSSSQMIITFNKIYSILTKLSLKSLGGVLINYSNCMKRSYAFFEYIIFIKMLTLNPTNNKRI